MRLLWRLPCKAFDRLSQVKNIFQRIITVDPDGMDL